MNRLGLFCAAGLLAGGVVLSGQRIAIPEPRRGAGDSITGAFEGWYYNQDGSRSFLIGYYNRNGRQELDVPIGPNNRIEPGGPDMGQPTHFEPGRHYGVFGIVVPKDYGTKKLTWTLVLSLVVMSKLQECLGSAQTRQHRSRALKLRNGGEN